MAAPPSPSGSRPWQLCLDAKLREPDARAYILRVEPETGPGADPWLQIHQYTHMLCDRDAALGCMLGYTSVRPLQDQVRLKRGDYMRERQLSQIRRCRLLVLVLDQAATVEGGQHVSMHLDAWLRTFELTQLKVLVFTLQPILLLWLPSMHCHFHYDREFAWYMLAPAEGMLETRLHNMPRPRHAICDVCRGPSVCAMHSPPHWQSVVNDMFAQLGPKAICIRGACSGFNIHAYCQDLIDDNSDTVVIYRDVHDTLCDRFPKSQEHRATLARTKLVIMNMPRYHSTRMAVQLCRKTTLILRQLDCEMPNAQFLLFVHQQPTMPPTWSVLSMDTHRAASGQSASVFQTYMIVSANMQEGHEVVHDFHLSGDETEDNTHEMDYDSDSDADSVEKEDTDTDNIFQTTNIFNVTIDTAPVSPDSDPFAVDM